MTCSSGVPGLRALPCSDLLALDVLFSQFLLPQTGPYLDLSLPISPSRQPLLVSQMGVTMATLTLLAPRTGALTSAGPQPCPASRDKRMKSNKDNIVVVGVPMRVLT